MGERIRISEYKGFELWDTPAPEGWRVHQYPVQVTCNGEHVNAFANAHDAMRMIDGMDADTIAYHMRRATTPPQEPAPVSAAGEERTLRTDLDADTLERWPRLIWNRMTKPEFEGFYTDDHGRNDILDLLEVVSTLRAKLAAAEALAETNAALLANAQSELATVRGERDAAVSTLRPFAFAYHVFNDQFASDYGNIINWQTDFANASKVTEWYKQASEVVGVDDAKAANALAADGEGDAQ
jgi:hypothetical protein